LEVQTIPFPTRLLHVSKDKMFCGGGVTLKEL
jgi:hypothetical protein